MEPNHIADPGITHLLTAITGLVVAIATLVATLKNGRSTKELHGRLNGPLDKLTDRVSSLSAQFRKMDQEKDKGQEGTTK